MIPFDVIGSVYFCSGRAKALYHASWQDAKTECSGRLGTSCFQSRLTRGRTPYIQIQNPSARGGELGTSLSTFRCVGPAPRVC